MPLILSFSPLKREKGPVKADPRLSPTGLGFPLILALGAEIDVEGRRAFLAGQVSAPCERSR